MNKISEKRLIGITALVIGVLALVTSLLANNEIIPLVYEFPILFTLFAIGIIFSCLMDCFYFKTKWKKKQTIGVIAFILIITICTILIWVLK